MYVQSFIDRVFQVFNEIHPNVWIWNNKENLGNVKLITAQIGTDRKYFECQTIGWKHDQNRWFPMWIDREHPYQRTSMANRGSR